MLYNTEFFFIVRNGFCGQRILQLDILNDQNNTAKVDPDHGHRESDDHEEHGDNDRNEKGDSDKYNHGDPNKENNGDDDKKSTWEHDGHGGKNSLADHQHSVKSYHG